jgi:PD-(D/E)XK nuclease superfamily protein
VTPNQKGAIAEAAIVKAATVFGVVVSRPIQDAAYDLIFDLHVTLLRIQCKWGVRRGDVLTIHCQRCRRGPDGFIRRRYQGDEIDAIAAYCADLDACYLLPRSLSVDRSAVQLRLAPTLNNQHRLINWARDYEFAARLATYGPIAQLGERLHGMQEAGGSSPPGSIA